MEYVSRAKFHATLGTDGVITPGAAFAGYVTSPLSSGYGVYYCLLETIAGDGWIIVAYDPDATDVSDRFQTSESGGVGVPTGTDISCSLIVPAHNYVSDTHMGSPGPAPLIESVRGIAIGKGANIGTGSADSLTLAGSVLADSPHSVSVGGYAGAAETTAVGFGASTAQFMDESYNNISTAGSTAIGYRASSSAAGEVALGNASVPHMSGVPIMTADPSEGGTFTFQAVAGYDTTNYAYLLANIADLKTLEPYYPASGASWVIHVQGIIVARATDTADDKVVKVEWVTGGTLTQTVMAQGANNISLGLALSGMRLQATVAAVAGLKLSGYLHVTKIAYKAH